MLSLYKLIFCKGYNISLRYHLAASPESAANHMHACLSLLIGINTLLVFGIIWLLFFGEKKTNSLLQNGIFWTIVFVSAFAFTYFYFLQGKKYISIVKDFYKTSRYKGKKGTLIAIFFIIGSNLLLLGLALYLGRDKLF